MFSTHIYWIILSLQPNSRAAAPTSMNGDANPLTAATTLNSLCWADERLAEHTPALASTRKQHLHGRNNVWAAYASAQR